MAMRKLTWLLALAIVSCDSPEPPAVNPAMAKPAMTNPAMTSGAMTNPAMTNPAMTGWQGRAEKVTITRDTWGIPHVHGPTDADAVFGLMYAQAEDDFNRVENNFLLSQGRLAEAAGEAEIWRDLRMKLFIDPEDMKAQFAASPNWLKALMDGWADGLNYYLYTHPEVKPRVITRFEPWMALTFSEGSIGGDIERVNLADLEAFYGKNPDAANKVARDEAGIIPAEPTGSNGFAIAPSNSASKHALLWINPHTSFFFRAEAQATSDEGLNAYGALTWGQFFIYQGFNEHAGWMHTSSGVDNIDEYLETVTRKGNDVFYKYGDEERQLTARTLVVPYKTATGMAKREFTVYRSHRGPIVREVDGKWVSVRLMEEPVKALIQSYTRTKARNLQEFKEIMNLHTNSSNNTVFADSEGNIAYFHANFIPKRDTRFDFTKPVDGGRTRQSEAEGLPALRRTQHGESARRSRHQGPEQEQGLHARDGRAGGVRQPTARARAARAHVDSRLRPAVGAQPVEAEARGPDRVAEEVGLPLGGRLGGDDARSVLGRRPLDPRDR